MIGKLSVRIRHDLAQSRFAGDKRPVEDGRRIGAIDAVGVLPAMSDATTPQVDHKPT